MINEATKIMVIAFITYVSTSGDANQPQMGTRKVKAAELGPCRYERVDKEDKHQAPGAVDHKVHSIGRCDM